MASTSPLSHSDAVTAITGLWGSNFAISESVTGDGGATEAEGLFGDLGSPKPAAPAASPAKPAPAAKPAPTAKPAPAAKPRAKSPAVAPAIRKKRPGLPSTAPRPVVSNPTPSGLTSGSDDSDDELPTGVAKDHAYEDPNGVFDDSEEEGGEDKVPQQAPGAAKKPKKRAPARVPLSSEALQERRLERGRERRERTAQGLYADHTSLLKEGTQRRAKALDMLDGLIPLGLDPSGRSTPIGLDTHVRTYLNQPEEAKRAPHEILHARVVALQRAASAPGALGVMEMRRVLKNPKWVPYERQRDLKNKTTTKGMSPAERETHYTALRDQAEEFHRVAADKREARRQRAAAAFDETECAVPIPKPIASAVAPSPLGAAACC